MMDFDDVDDIYDDHEDLGVETESDIADTTESTLMIDHIDSYADSTMLTQEYLTKSISDGGRQVSFAGQIDDLYDPSINSAQDDLICHLEDAVNARTTDDLEYHLDKAKEALRSEDYWRNAKWEAEIESKRHDIFMDEINEQWEIIDKYQKGIEDIYKR